MASERNMHVALPNIYMKYIFGKALLSRLERCYTAFKLASGSSTIGSRKEAKANLFSILTLSTVGYNSHLIFAGISTLMSFVLLSPSCLKKRAKL